MNLFAVVLALAASPHVVTPPNRPAASLLAQDKCANGTSHLAVQRSDPAKPQKLTELPDAQTYAAVYRVVGGCAVPVLYRDVRGVGPLKR